MTIDYRGLHIPLTQLGTNITSDNLFDPNEQVIFDFYEANKGRYHKAVDIGANIGVHSILMAQQGWQVRAFEPDPTHYAMLRRNVFVHDVAVRAAQAAVSDRTGSAEFVRVLDNTTGNHLMGVKDSYGPRETIEVPIVDCRPLFEWADFVKIDCEGHEAALMATTTTKTWWYMDALLEVGAVDNAAAIYQRLQDWVPMWAQKINWARVQSFDDMPVRHQDGSLFIGHGAPFPSMYE